MTTYDIVVWGATSFAGQYVAKHLINVRQAECKVAIAGRDKSRLSELASKLERDVDIVVGNADDESFLQELVASTEVIISTVGPYALYGSLLVKQVAQQGKAYCDLTGEPQWIWHMLKQHEKLANETGARIIHCCGFDSIPSDAGVYQIQQSAFEQFGEYCQQIHYRFKTSKGGFSGGTVATMVNAIKQIKMDKQKARILKTPYALLSNGNEGLPYQYAVKSLYYDEQSKQNLVPFIMASINTKIVHRTNEQLGRPWGREFLYDESMQVGKGVKGKWRGLKFMTGLTLFALSITNKFTRRFMEKFVLPKPGEGPSESLVKNGYFEVDLLGKTQSGNRVAMTITGKGDPGYGSTAKMISEVSLMLFEKKHNKLGFLTPISAFETTLIERLVEHADIKFIKK